MTARPDRPPPPDGRAGIDAALVRRLLAEQHPRWAGLLVVPVPVDGHDNRTYRLGHDLAVRLPTADRYTAGVAKEHTWLPVLAPRLPLPVPEPVALGEPSAIFGRPWSVRRWLPGETLATRPVEQVGLAHDLAGFLTALRSVPATGCPAAGEHSFHRGGSLTAYDGETRAGLAALGLDGLRVWEAGLETVWEGPPVWFHGDVAVGNLLGDHGRLAAVIDFGTCGVGDPACDLVVAWTHLDDEARTAFRAGVGLDAATWARARAWALWKAVITLVQDPDDDVSRRVVRRVVAEHDEGRRPVDDALRG